MKLIRLNNKQQIEHSAPTYSGLSQSIRVEPGKEYELTAYIKGNNIKKESGQAGGDAQAQLVVDTAFTDTDNMSNAGNFDWQKNTLTFTAPESGIVKLTCQMGTEANQLQGKVWFDDVSIRRISPDEPVAPVPERPADVPEEADLSEYPIVYRTDLDSDDDTWIKSDRYCWNAIRAGMDESEPGDEVRHHDDCLMIERRNSENYVSRISKKFHFDSNKKYIATCYIKAEGLETTGDWGAYMKVSGTSAYQVAQPVNYVNQNVSIQQLKASTVGNFGWKKVQLDFYVLDGNDVELEFCMGEGAKGTAYFDNLEIYAQDDIQRIESEHLEYFVREKYLDEISVDKLNDWLAYMDDVYETYQQLTGYTPYDGKKIRVVTTYNMLEGTALAGNPILYRDGSFKEQLQSIEDRNDSAYGIMHEMSHDFDHPSVNFHAEIWSNFKVYLALRSLGRGQVDRYVSSGTYTCHSAEELKRYMQTDSNWSYTKTILPRTAVNIDSFDYCLVRIVDELGWDRFVAAFPQALTEIRGKQTCEPFNRGKFMDYINTLQKYYHEGGTEVVDTFPEGELEYILDSLGKEVRTIWQEDFEDETQASQNWTSFGAHAASSIASEGGMDNSKCIRVDADAQTFAGMRRTFHAQAGKVYYLTGYVKGENIISDGIGAGGCSTNVWACENNGNYAGTFDYKPFGVRIECNHDMDIDLACALGYFELEDKTNKAQGTAWFDNLKLVEAEEINIFP